MLYIFVDNERCHVFYATYDEDDANKFMKNVETQFAARYWDDVEIYEVIENYDD